MYYEYFRSEGCNRFSIGNRKTIAVTPTAKTQMILGTNGSGKTSFLSILANPCPANPKDFDGNGSREVHILHKGHRYEIQEQYGDRNVYSFKKDGVELNRDGKVTPQWALVEEHLQYDRELHALLVGDIEFTSLSPQKRRDWIARLSTVDFDYAFAEYDRYRKGHTKSKNIVEHLQGRINEESEKLIREEDLQQMRDHVRELHETLDLLMREPRSTAAEVTDQHIETRLKAATRLIEGTLTSEWPDLGDFTQLLEEQNNKVGQIKGELNARGERVAELETRLVRIDNMLETSPELIEADIRSLQQTLAAIPVKRTSVPDEILTDASEPINELRQVLINLPDEYVGQAEVNSILVEAQAKRQKANKIEGVLREITIEIDHIRRCATVNCPQCSYVFKPGVEPGRLEALEARAVKGTHHLAEAGGVASEAEDWLQRITEKAELFAELNRIKERYRQHTGLWMFIDECGGLEKGRGLIHELARYVNEVKMRYERISSQKRLDELQMAMAKWREESGVHDQLVEELAEARRAYNDVHARYLAESGAWADLRRSAKYADDWENLHTQAEQIYKDLRENLIHYVHQAVDKEREEIIRKTRTTLGINEAALSENEVIAAVVKDLENQLNKAKIEEEAYRRLVAAMCPKTGFIAEQITDQIGSIVGGMNRLIKKVWNYPLYIKMPESEENDVSYKFPIVVDGKEREDIDQGSKSIKAVINTAFRLVAYYCLNLTDYPLFLDEPGQGFDEVHMQNLIPLVKDLVDSERFSQVFIISHDIDAQTAFPNSQTIIMDARNIPHYPHPYNTHVEVA